MAASTERVVNRAFGVDVRNEHQGINTNRMASYIGSIDPAQRARDAQFYKDMPMHTFATDPTNHKPQRDSEARVRAVIARNAERAETERQGTLAASRDIAPSPTSTPAAPDPAPAAPDPAPAAAPDPAPAAPDLAFEASLGRRCRTTIAAVYNDLNHWTRSPSDSVSDKLRTIVTQDSRSSYIYLLLAVLIILAIVVGLCFRARNSTRAPM